MTPSEQAAAAAGVFAQCYALREKSEALFGPRVDGWEFVGINFTVNGPKNFFPEGFDAKLVAINLTPDTLRFPDKALYQTAHEVVHLLAPGPPPGTMFEEGVAVWFSLHGPDYSPGYRDGAMRDIAETPDNYRDALEAYEELIAIAPDAVKRLRAIKPAFDVMTPAFIVSQIPEVPAGLAERLCEQRQMR